MISVCLAGHYRNDSECLPCEAGQYRGFNDSESACTSCPTNSTTKQSGSTSISDCGIFVFTIMSKCC